MINDLLKSSNLKITKQRKEIIDIIELLGVDATVSKIIES